MKAFIFNKAATLLKNDLLHKYVSKILPIF